MSSKIFYESASRNQRHILEVIRTVIQLPNFTKQENLFALEIASGTGQHAVEFSREIPKFIWQPTEVDENCLDSIKAYKEDSRLTNLKDPVIFDVSKENGYPSDWIQSFDMLLAVNLIHISPWSCTEGLFKTAGICLKDGGCLLTYGAYAMDGIISPESNLVFNRSLKSRNPEWGIRDIKDLKVLAKQNGLHLREIFDMPSNNKTLFWTKSTE